jgi:activator of HSP90 ATPase
MQTEVLSMTTKDIQQKSQFKAAPHDVYEALMDSRKHARFTGAPARISRKPGGTFSAYDGYITGVNIELLPDTRIVQAWRGSDWPEGWYSLVVFSLKTVKGGTRLDFTQIGVPAMEYRDIYAGWGEYYWKPMKVMFNQA